MTITGRGALTLPAGVEVAGVKLRLALSGWQVSTGDRGGIAEAELARRFWPDGRQPVTAAPVVAAKGCDSVVLQSPAAGASIIYRLDGGDWRLYTGPLPLATGTRLAAKAVRYGWAESPVTSYQRPAATPALCRQDSESE